MTFGDDDLAADERLERVNEREEDAPPLSECCGARITISGFCSDCKEHA